MNPYVIAIDGPAGTGKSTVAKKVAEKLNFSYFDTGATYRLITLQCQREGVDFADTEGVANMVAFLNLSLKLNPLNPRFLIDGEDVTAMIRTDEVAMQVSKVATNLTARKLLGELQRKVIESELEAGRGVVAEGRDITTVIAPDAQVRVLMTATEEVRMARRAGEGADLATIEAAVLGRDRQDSKVVNFTEAAPGVHTVDTSDLTIDEAVAAVLSLTSDAD